MSAASMIEFVIAYALEALPKEYHNMTSVLELFHTYIQNNGDAYFVKWIKDNPNTLSTRLFSETQATRPSDRTFASTAGIAASHLN